MGRREVRVRRKHPLAKPILVLLVKQVPLCPVPPACTQPCHCGLPLCRCREPGLARGQCYCPTIAAVLFQFNKELMRNNEVWALSSATCSGDSGVRKPRRALGSKAPCRNPCTQWFTSSGCGTSSSPEAGRARVAGGDGAPQG